MFAIIHKELHKDLLPTMDFFDVEGILMEFVLEDELL